MNILFLNSSRRWGGNEKWTRMAAHALAADHNVFLAYRKEAIGERFTVPKFRLPFLNEADLYTLAKLMGIALKYKIDILVPTKPKEYVLAGMVAKLLRKKNVLRLGIVKDLDGSLLNRLIYGKLAHGIIVNAEPIKTAMVKSPYLQNDKVRVIYNGLDTAEMDELSGQARGIRKPFPFTVTVVGELS
jgi:hypothetical protein